MPRFVAFLRAVNVGGRTVKMDELRRLVAAAGLDDVETFIASGNVIFSSSARNLAAVEQRVERALREGLGFDVPAFVRTTADVAAAAAHRAFPEADVARAGAHLVAFLRGPLDAAGRRGLASLESPLDRFVARGREVYWLSTPKQSETTLTLVKFERALGQPATMRSMTSVGKLAARHCGA
ncbi:MAG: DUF1697 domain-containing protein [Vicinamibacterales bacterium]